MNEIIVQVLTPESLTILAIVALMWWFLPKLMAKEFGPATDRGRKRYEEGARTNVTRGLTGLSVIFGILITIWQSHHADQLASETRILEQYQKATEGLASKSLAMHAGAVTALVQSGRLKPELRRGVIIQLAQAAVTYSDVDPRITLARSAGCQMNITRNLSPLDSQASLVGLASRPFFKDQPFPIFLRGGYFRGSSIPSAYFNHTDFSGVDLAGSDLYAAHLHEANFRFANLNGASLSGADLTNAGLEGASLCSGPNYSVAALERNGDVPARAAGAAFHDANLSNAYFNGAILDDAIIQNAAGEGADFSRASIVQTKFVNSNFSHAKFIGVIAKCAEFVPDPGGHEGNRTLLVGAVFKDAVLPYSLFTRAALEDANFDGANLSYADFRGATIERKALAMAKLCRTVWIDGSILEPDCADSNRKENCESEEQKSTHPPPWKLPAFHDYADGG